MKTQLLCTFAAPDQLDHILFLISECSDVLFGKIFVLENVNNPYQLMCTYNIEQTGDYITDMRDTISLHRKKQTNTLYTINAINCIIKELNNGVLDKRYVIPWDNYQNSLLLNKGQDSYQIIKTKIHTVHNL